METARTQDKRHAQLEHINQRIARQHSRLFRVANVLDKLVKAARRVEKAIDAELQEKADEAARAVKRLKVAQAAPPASEPVTAPVARLPVDDPLDIRNQQWATRGDADKKAEAEILAEQAAGKKKKTMARIDKLKADKAGDRKKMPLTGKAALAAIRS